MKIIGRDQNKPKETHYLPSIELSRLYPITDTANSKEEVVEDQEIDSTNVLVGSKTRWWIVGIVIVLLLMAVLWYKYLHTGTKITELPSNHDVVSIDSSFQEEPNKLKNELSEEVLAEGCIVITGTFSKERNAREMLANISYKGYETYESKHNGLNRVGLRFKCDSIDLDSMLLSIRSEFSQKAWYLSPNYKPDFD